MPPPTHMVTTPYLAPRRLPSISSVAGQAGPATCHKGWPIEIAPPLTFSFSFVDPEHGRRIWITWHGERLVQLPQVPMSSMVRPLQLQQLGDRVDTGPMPISSGSSTGRPPCRDRRPRGCSPRRARLRFGLHQHGLALAPSDSCAGVAGGDDAALLDDLAVLEHRFQPVEVGQHVLRAVALVAWLRVISSFRR